MTTMAYEHSYNEVVASIESKNKKGNAFKEKTGRSDRGNIHPTQENKRKKAWMADGTMYMNE